MTAHDWTRGLARGASSAKIAATRPSNVRKDVPIEQQAVALLGEGSSKVDIEHATEVFALLAQSPSGRDDIELFIEHRINLVFDTRRGGAGYVRGGRVIILNRTQVAARTALDFVHEVTHARFHVTNTGCDPDASKEAFVRGILFEESHTYLREAVVGRELIHVVRDPRVVKSLFTVHPVQMWFQLVHGVAYNRAPTNDILNADAGIEGRTVLALQRDVHPYFARFVEFYRNVEGAKWEIRRGIRRPEKQEVVSGVLSMCAEEQPHEWTYPLRRVR